MKKYNKLVNEDIRNINLPDDYIDNIENINADKANMANPAVFMHLLNDIREIESSYIPQLNALAVRIVKDYYDPILDGISIDAKIIQGSNSKESKERDKSFIKLKRVKKENEINDEHEDDVKKRKILNAILQGQAQLFHDIIFEYEEELNKMHPSYVSKMKTLLDIAEAFYWKFDSSFADMASASSTNMVEVGWDDKNSVPDLSNITADIENGNSIEDIYEDDNYKTEEELEMLSSGEGMPWIKARSIVFPLLVHEVVKGIYDLILHSNIDTSDVEKETYVKKQTSTPREEFEDIKYGKQLAIDITQFLNTLSNIDAYPNMKEFLYGYLASLPNEDFFRTIEGMLMYDEDVKEELEMAVDRIVKDIKNSQTSSNYNNDTLPINNVNVEPSNLSKSEIFKLIDIALDAGDYAKAAELQKLLKENFNKIKL